VPAALSLPAARGLLLLFRDILHFNLPQQVFAAAARAQWRLPLWDPGRYGGAPFFAEPGTGVLYPANLLFHLLDPPRAATCFVLVHLPLAAAGMWLLARRLGLGETAAALAATGFCGSGYLLSMHGGHYYFASAAWLPLATAALLRAADLKTGRALGLAALAVALPILNGEFQALWFAGLLALLLAACGPQDRLRAVGAVALALAAGALLGAVQLLPTALFARATVRGTGLALAEAQSWSLPPARFIELMVPAPFGLPWPDNANWTLVSSGAHHLPWAVSLFIGPALVVPALLPGRDRRQVALLAACALTLLLALGSALPLFAAWHRLVPLADRFRYPEKYALPATVALCLLGAWRAEQLAPRTTAVAFGAAAALFALACGVALAEPEWLQQAIARGLRENGAIVSAAAAHRHLVLALAETAVLCAVLSAVAAARAAFLLPALLAAAAVGAIVHGGAVLSWGDGSFLARRPAWVDLWPAGRVLNDGSCRFPGGGEGTLIERTRQWEFATAKENFPLLFGRREMLGYGASESARQVTLFRALRPAGLVKAAQLFGASAILGCQGNELHIWPIDRPIPLVRVVRGSPASDVAAALLQADPGSQAIVEGAAVEAEPGARAEVIEDAPEHVRVRTTGAGLLVLAEAWAPGWSATLDGAPVEVRIADGQFRAVAVPSGGHEVSFDYAQPGLWAGALISLAALLSLAGIARGSR